MGSNFTNLIYTRTRRNTDTKQFRPKRLPLLYVFHNVFYLTETIPIKRVNIGLISEED